MQINYYKELKKKIGVVLGGDSRHCKSWNLWNKNYVGLVGEKPSDQVFFQIKSAGIMAL